MTQHLNTFNKNHYLGVTTTNALSVGGEGSHQVGGGQKAVLVSIHDTEGLLELLDSRVGEGLEDVGFLGHLEDLVVASKSCKVNINSLIKTSLE